MYAKQIIYVLNNQCSIDEIEPFATRSYIFFLIKV